MSNFFFGLPLTHVTDMQELFDMELALVILVAAAIVLILLYRSGDESKGLAALVAAAAALLWFKADDGEELGAAEKDEKLRKAKDKAEDKEQSAAIKSEDLGRKIKEMENSSSITKPDSNDGLSKDEIRNWVHSHNPSSDNDSSGATGQRDG